MIKRKTIETVEEYDANGKITRKVTTETTEDDEGSNLSTPWWWGIYPPYNPNYPQVTYTSATSATVKSEDNNK
jgi:hypothetical protein